MPCRHRRASPRLPHPSLPMSSGLYHKSISKKPDRCSPCVHHTRVGPPLAAAVVLWAGLGEKPSSQLVRCPGPLVSGFPALHNLSIRAKYICHPPLSGDWETSRALQNSGEKKHCVTPSGGPGLSRHAGADAPVSPALGASVGGTKPTGSPSGRHLCREPVQRFLRQLGSPTAAPCPARVPALPHDTSVG